MRVPNKLNFEISKLSGFRVKKSTEGRLQQAGMTRDVLGHFPAIAVEASLPVCRFLL